MQYFFCGSRLIQDPKAEQKYSWSQYFMGALHEHGLRDPKNAAKWCSKAAEQKYAWPQYFMGALYEHGHGFPKDKEKAYTYYYLASLLGLKEKVQENLDALEGKKMRLGNVFHLSKEKIDKARLEAERILQKLR